MSDEQELFRRNTELKSKLDRHRASKKVEEVQERRAGYRAYNDGFRLVIEFVSAILVGGLLGYFIDINIGTLPGGLIIGILLGFATGVYNLIKYGQTHSVKNNPDQTKNENDADLAN